MTNRERIQKMTLAAFFLALAFVMPYLTGQIPEVGAMLCPMHLPILLAGFLCGPLWGAAVGLVAPLLRSVTLGMPPLFPTATAMAFELLTYGLIAGLMHRLLPKRRGYIYLSLVIAMIVGRLVWGVASFVCLGVSGGGFTFSAFIAGAVTGALPGIAAQIVLIPLLVMLLESPRFLGKKK